MNLSLQGAYPRPPHKLNITNSSHCQSVPTMTTYNKFEKISNK